MEDQRLQSYPVKGGTFIKDRNGKLVTNREEVLKVWEGHYSELLNHEGNMSDLESPNYVIIIIILFIYFMLFLQMQGAHSLLQAHCYKSLFTTSSPAIFNPTQTFWIL